MKNIIYSLMVIFVLIVGGLLFVIVGNDDKDIMSSVMNIFDNPSSVISEVQEIDFDKLGSVSSSIAQSVSSSMHDSMPGSLGSIGNAIGSIGSSISNAPSVLKNSTSAVYKNGHFVMGYEDGLLEIVNSSGDEKKIVLHNKRINNLYIVENKLMASSDDGSLSVVDLDMLTIVKQLKGHGKEVEGVVAFGNLIFSVSRDRTIKVWEIGSTGLISIIKY